MTDHPTRNDVLYPPHQRTRIPKAVTGGIIGQLCKARVQQGISHTRLAKITGYSRGAIRHMETGKNSPRFHMVQDIADVLGFDVVLVPRDDQGVT